jgi:hypothetical protein
VQAFASIASIVNSLPDEKVRDVLRYHTSTGRVALVPWNPTGVITTALGLQTLELAETK